MRGSVQASLSMKPPVTSPSLSRLMALTLSLHFSGELLCGLYVVGSLAGTHRLQVYHVQPHQVHVCI